MAIGPIGTLVKRLQEHLREYERDQCKFENVTSGILLAKKICDTICENDPECIRDIEAAEKALKDPESEMSHTDV